jgi:hypothetical protein
MFFLKCLFLFISNVIFIIVLIINYICINCLIAFSKLKIKRMLNFFSRSCYGILIYALLGMRYCEVFNVLS